MHISVVIPLYRCSKSLLLLTDRLNKVLSGITSEFEIIYVNDASPENDWEIVKELSERDKRIKGITFSRNFGQHYAITAGLTFASGDWIIVMDGDLQDKPEEIPSLYAKAREGNFVVFARREMRMDSFLKRTTSKIFYRVFDYFTGNTSDNRISNFGIYSKVVIESYNNITERYRLFPLVIKWLGYKTAYVNVEHAQRLYGKSSYNYRKLINLAIDIIIAQSNKPLRLSIKFGFLMSLFSLFYLIYLTVRYFYFDVPLGWTSIMVSIFFIGGLLFANLGLLGLYLGKIFDETKRRPLYIIESKTNTLEE